MSEMNEYCYSLFVDSVYIIENTFDPPSDITAIPQSYTVHCIIAGENIDEFHYYYQGNSNINLTSTYCSSQTGYDCSLATNNTVISYMTPDDVRDKTITVTWEAEEICSGAFRQDSNDGDHVIKCNVSQGAITRESTVTIKGIHIEINVLISLRLRALELYIAFAEEGLYYWSYKIRFLYLK